MRARAGVCRQRPSWMQTAARQGAILGGVNPRLSLILFLVLVVGGGLLIGAVVTPGDWYAGLAKPAFNPPGWVFGPAWTILYVLIAIAGWRVWERDRRGPAMKLWWAQLLLNFCWTPVFFGAQRIGLALVVILLLLAHDRRLPRRCAADGPGGGVALRALRRLGGVRDPSQRLDPRAELTARDARA